MTDWVSHRVVLVVNDVSVAVGDLQHVVLPVVEQLGVEALGVDLASKDHL